MDMPWQISYFNRRIQDEILSWPPGIKARYLKVADLMVAYGPDLGMPHTRAMGSGLFEIRLKSREGIARVFFCTQAGQWIKILHCFIKKTSKTPSRELDIARRRLMETKGNA